MKSSVEGASPLRDRLARRIGISPSVLPTAVAVLVLIAVRFVVAAVLPLSSDEAYYWLWSRHLSPGYLDHPPAIAFFIRAGTLIFGDTSLGVRFGAIVASALATAFVWRAAADLFDETVGARAALYFNLTLMVAAEMLAATPDAPALLFSAAFLYALVRVNVGGDGRWWIAAGVAAGLALLSKFTAFFVGAGAVLWLLLDPSARRWLVSPWPYLGAVLALVIDTPNLFWNAQHGWATFAFQFGRVDQGHFTLRFLIEFLAAQIGLVSPAIFVLGATGLVRSIRDASLRLVGAMLWPGVAYFLVHSLHDRVQANWPSFLVPAFSIAAAAVLANTQTQTAVTRILKRCAIPIAAVLLIAVYAQALFGAVPMGRSDPLSRLLAVGFDNTVKEVDASRMAARAPALLVTDYASAAWFSFYLPSHAPIVAAAEPQRWTYATPADRALLAQPLVYVVEKRLDRRDLVATHFHDVVLLGEIDRLRGRIVIARYAVYRVGGWDGTALGHVLP